MKKLYTLVILAVAVCIIPAVGFGQPGVGGIYIGDYSKMSSKTSMDREMELGNWAYKLSNLKSNKYNFTVIMRDNSVKRVQSKIYADSLKNKSYLIADNYRIYCDQTKRISRINGNDDITGIATDSCWLFKITSGKINSYSFLSETKGLNAFYLLAIQAGGGEIQNFMPYRLEAIIGNDAKAMKAYQKRDYLKAIEKYNSDNQ